MRGTSFIKQLQDSIQEKEKILSHDLQQLGRQLSQSATKMRQGEDYVLRKLAFSFHAKSTEIGQLLTEIVTLKETEFLLSREKDSRGESSKSNEEKK